MTPIYAARNKAPVRTHFVFGERCSGTNFVDGLIRRNFPAMVHSPGDRIGPRGFRFGWKHGFPQMLAAPPWVLAVAVFRKPEDWVRSFHARPWHAAKPLRGLPFAEFLRREWVAVIDELNFGIDQGDPFALQELQWDRHPMTGQRFRNVVEMRNAKNQGFLSLRHRFQNALLLRYEDVLAAPEALVAFIAQNYGLERTPDFVPNTVDRKRGGKPFEPKDYAPLAPEDHAFLWQELDAGIETALGYAQDG